MATILIVLSTWLHVLATIVFIGYYLFTSQIYLPVLERCLHTNTLRDLLEQVSARLRPFFGGSLLVFMVTGTYLMLIDESYQGLGNFFANPWSILIIVKHILVLAFLIVAVFSERAYLVKISDQKPEALRQFKRSLNTNLMLGLGILLLTSVAQVG